MNKKIYTVYIGTIMLAMLACSNDNVTGSSEDPNVLTAKTKSSSSFDEEMLSSVTIAKSSSSIKIESSSSKTLVLCKVASGNQGCVIEPDTADLWVPGMDHVNTKIFAKNPSNFGERAGEFFLRTDSAEGGKSTITWDGGSIVDIELDGGDLKDYPYVDIGFYVAGFDSDGVPLYADISNWNGLCFMFVSEFLYYDRFYHGSYPMVLLEFEDESVKFLGSDRGFPFVYLEDGLKCYEWNQFGPSGPPDDYYGDEVRPYWDENDYFAGEKAATHVARIVIRLKAPPGKYRYFLKAIGTNRDE